MKRIENFKLASNRGTQWHESEESLLNDEGFKKLQVIYEYLKKFKSCHVFIKEGDYKGSIAEFTVDEGIERYGYRRGELYYPVQDWFNVKYYWEGRLSWKNKRNNPKFTISHDTCDVLLGYEGEEILKRFNLKEEGKKLLSQDVHDIDGMKLSVGDEVLYLNIRYGSGGSLCHGVVGGFKAHARDGYVSVIVTNKDNSSQESECRQPWNQIYKVVSNEK